MRVAGLVIFSAIIFTACKNFDGVVGNVNEDYTTRYNYPGMRTVPYDDPHVENKEPNKEVKVCTGIPKKSGFQCQK